jgi:hypothetical protein
VDAYRERLRVPLRRWVQGTMLVVSVWLAFIIAVPPALAWSITGVAGAVLAGCLLTYGSLRIGVADGVLTVGRARIETRFLGAAEALDAEESRRIAGQDADARAYLATRPYLKRSVRVWIEDSGDPTPYWLLSTRRPEALVAALATAPADASAPTRPSSTERRTP